MMARKKATTVVEEVEDLDEAVELEELEELDAVNDEADVSDESGMLTAKAAAKLLGTDGRTLRKFLRKKHGILGQGKRWEVDPDDIDELKAEFADYAKPKPKADEKPAKAKKTTTTKTDAEIYGDDDVDEDFEEIETLDDLDGPDEDELDELEELDIDDE